MPPFPPESRARAKIRRNHIVYCPRCTPQTYKGCAPPLTPHLAERRQLQRERREQSTEYTAPVSPLKLKRVCAAVEPPILHRNPNKQRKQTTGGMLPRSPSPQTYRGCAPPLTPPSCRKAAIANESEENHAAAARDAATSKSALRDGSKDSISVATPRKPSQPEGIRYGGLSLMPYFLAVSRWHICGEGLHMRICIGCFGAHGEGSVSRYGRLSLMPRVLAARRWQMCGKRSKT